MKQPAGTVLLAALILLAAGAALAADLAANLDPSGNYNFTLSESVIKGPCPLGQDGQGELTISSAGAGYTLGYIKGMVCSPKEVCFLSGTCNNGRCLFTTTVVVDNEGGAVTNTADLTFDANGAAGKGSCVYQHPKGMKCTWTYSLVLTR